MIMIKMLNFPRTPSVFLQEVHSVREFVVKAFAKVGVQIAWSGEGVNEVGKDAATDIVRVDVSEKVRWANE